MCQHIHVYICIMYTCIHPFFLFVKVCTNLLCSWGMSRHESLEVPAGCELSHGQTQSHSWHPKFFSQKRMVQHATTIDNPQLFRLICGFTLELPSTQGQFNLIHVPLESKILPSCLVVSCGRLDCAAPRLSNSSTA
jgi:hypothetical protein